MADYKMVLGGSSESKRFESWSGVLVDLVRTSIVDRPTEHIEMITLSCIIACLCIPGAALAPEPLQYL